MAENSVDAEIESAKTESTEFELEFEVAYLFDAPQILPRTWDKQTSGWHKEIVSFSPSDIWLPVEGSWDIIPIKTIELVGRKLPASSVNQIQRSTGYSNVLVIDYMKQSSFASSLVNTTLIFAGHADNIRQIRSYLLTILGFSVDAERGNLTPEEMRLLVLLESGIRDVDILLPIFANNKILLQHAFTVLTKREMCDEYARVTQIGHEYVEEVKGKGQGNLGGNIENEIRALHRRWGHVDLQKPDKSMCKIVWKYNDSILTGRINLRDFWNFAHPEIVSHVQLKEAERGILNLIVGTSSGSSITIIPNNKVDAYAFKMANDTGTDMDKRILCFLYLGITNQVAIANNMHTDVLKISSCFEDMVNDGYIDNSNNLLSAGRNIIQKMLGSMAETDEAIEKFSELKKDEVKAKILKRMEAAAHEIH